MSNVYKNVFLTDQVNQKMSDGKVYYLLHHDIQFDSVVRRVLKEADRVFESQQQYYPFPIAISGINDP